MAYPTDLDTLVNDIDTTTFEDDTGYEHDVVHNDADTAIMSIEAKVGIDDSAVTTSHDYRINALEEGVASFHSYLGYNTIGGSTENATALRVYAKKITVVADAFCMTVDAYIDGGVSSDTVGALGVAIYDDSSGTPNRIIAASVLQTNTLLLDDTSGAGGNTDPRWLQTPLGAFLVAGDYWIAVQFDAASQPFRLYYDATGSDRYYTSGGGWFADWGWYSPTTSGNKYSIRASMLG